MPLAVTSTIIRHQRNKTIDMELKESLKDLVFDKSDLRREVYMATREAFDLFRTTAREVMQQLQQDKRCEKYKERFSFTNRGDFEFEVKFGSDVLLFLMHSNIFEFSRDHQVMKSPYIREDATRSHCGVIRIFNFLADSIEYRREQDLGYMIGRVFINKEKHYFIEGKRELGMLYSNFNTALITSESVQNIVESAIEYTTNFDLLTPPYDDEKVVSVGEMMTNFDKKTLVTGKRLGFQFQADTE